MEVQSVRELAAVIRRLRREKGWSQATLAREAGVGREWIIHLEKARPTVELGLVMGTLKALGVHLRIDPQAPQTDPEIDLNRILGDTHTSENR
jgi:HTH-type transcriptional regulator/antitoxin HipB